MNDLELAQAIRSLPVPDHAPGFWERLDAELSGDAYAPRTPAGRRRRWWSPLAAAALVLLVAGYVLVRTSVLDGPGRESTAASPAAVLPAPARAAQQFLTDAARGDAAAVAPLLGPGSKAYGRASGQGTAALLAAGTWPDPAESTLVDLALDDDHHLVLVRHDGVTLALPVRHDGRWLVEPWAHPGADAEGIGVATSTVASGDPLRFTTPVDGTLAVGLDVSIDTRLPTTDRQTGWVPTAIGDHLLLAAIAEGDVFVATAEPLVIDPEPGTPAGAASMFRYWWFRGETEAMARYGSAEAIAQSSTIPTDGWSAAASSGCEGAAGSVYCTWTRSDGVRFVLRVDDVDRPPRVVEVRIEPPSG